MSEPKTRPTNINPIEFLEKNTEGERLKDCITILNLMKGLTSKEAVMWGESIIGFGEYIYTYTGKEITWPITGFSPRKNNITIYIMSGFGDYMDNDSEYHNIMSQLGKFKTGKSCLYIKSIKDIDITILEKLIKKSLDYFKSNYKTNL